MKTKTLWHKALLGCAALWLIGGSLVHTGQAITLTLTSDANTQSVDLGPGVPDSTLLARLDSGDTTGLTFGPAAVGSYGTGTPLPTGAPVGTTVINVAPISGENGFFRLTFTLPVGFSGISLTGAGNVDDRGRAFLNGNPISPSIVAGDPNVLNQYDSHGFSTTNAAFFQPGVNTLLLSDANVSGGPSGAAFYATISFVPEPSTWSMIGFSSVVVLVVAARRQRTKG